MTRYRDSGGARKVSEPVQVYLDAPQRNRLDALAEHLELSKSDVIRLGLESLEQQLSDPSNHPALRIVGIAGKAIGAASDGDLARQHDRYLADSEVASWKPAPRRKRAR